MLAYIGNMAAHLSVWGIILLVKYHFFVGGREVESLLPFGTSTAEATFSLSVTTRMPSHSVAH